VKGAVETGYLGNLGIVAAQGFDQMDFLRQMVGIAGGRVVKRGQHRRGDALGRAKAGPAEHDAVPDHVQRAGRHARREPLDQHIDGGDAVGDGELALELVGAGAADAEAAVRAADVVDGAIEYPLQSRLGLEQGELDAR
jgi:hypothetical protein